MRIINKLLFFYKGDLLAGKERGYKERRKKETAN